MQKNRVLHKLGYEKSNDKLFGEKRKSNIVTTLVLEPTFFEVWQNGFLYFGVVIGNLG